MVNVNKLKGKMVEHGLTIAELANRIGIDRATFYRRLNSDGKDFTIEEADLIVKELNLSGTEASAIFFSQYVAQHATCKEDTPHSVAPEAVLSNGDFPLNGTGSNHNYHWQRGLRGGDQADDT